MMSFGPTAKHVLDCFEANDEVIAKAKAFSLHQRQKIVCPHMIPISDLELKNYEQLNKVMIKENL